MRRCGHGREFPLRGAVFLGIVTGCQSFNSCRECAAVANHGRAKSVTGRSAGTASLAQSECGSVFHDANLQGETYGGMAGQLQRDAGIRDLPDGFGLQGANCGKSSFEVIFTSQKAPLLAKYARNGAPYSSSSSHLININSTSSIPSQRNLLQVIWGRSVECQELRAKSFRLRAKSRSA